MYMKKSYIKFPMNMFRYDACKCKMFVCKMEMIGESIKERGLNTIYLMTDRNQPAYGFYKKMGFQELPELTSFVKET